MKIIVRKDSKMSVAKPERIDDETELQELILRNPSIIPVDEIRGGASELVFAVKEFWTGSMSVDVLAFSPSGDVAVVECKKVDRPNKAYEAIGQVIACASSLWGMTYEELDSRIRNKVGSGLLECVKSRFEGEFDDAEFIDGVSRSLREGSFILIVAVSEIDNKLKRVIDYVNEHSRYSIHALEVSRFTTGNDLEILIPHVHGVLAKPASTITEMWDEEKFFKSLEERHPEAVDVVREIYDWCRSSGEVEFGRGKKIGSFDFVCKVGDEKVKVFGIDTDAKLWMAFGDVQKRGVVSEEVLEEFQRKVRETVKSLSHADKYPSVGIREAFKDENDLKKFKELIDDFIRNIQSGI